MTITNSSDHGKGRIPGGQWVEEMDLRQGHSKGVVH